jgi:hypothetical protein
MEKTLKWVRRAAYLAAVCVTIVVSAIAILGDRNIEPKVLAARYSVAS